MILKFLISVVGVLKNIILNPIYVEFKPRILWNYQTASNIESKERSGYSAEIPKKSGRSVSLDRSQEKYDFHVNKPRTSDHGSRRLNP